MIANRRPLAPRPLCRWLACLALFAWAVWCPPAFAHGDLHERIAGVSAEIEKNPKDAKLYVLRAELYRLHQEFDLAFADLDTAAELDPALADTSFIRGRVYVDQQMPTAALAAFSRHLKLAPDHVEGYIARAQVLQQQKQFAKAAEDYATAIAKAKEPLPEYYIEHARLLLLAATPQNDNRAAAIGTLDAGIAKLGPIVTLELEAVGIEEAGQLYDSALKRLDQCMAQSPRKETWLERKGQVLEKAGRRKEAWTAYRDGLQAIAELPDRNQALPMVKELKDRLTTALQRVSQTATPEAPAPAKP